MILLLTVFCGDGIPVPSVPSDTQTSDVRVPSLLLKKLPSDVASDATSSLGSSVSSTSSDGSTGHRRSGAWRTAEDWDKTLAEFAAAREKK